MLCESLECVCHCVGEFISPQTLLSRNTFNYCGLLLALLGDTFWYFFFLIFAFPIEAYFLQLNVFCLVLSVVHNVGSVYDLRATLSPLGTTVKLEAL